MTSKIRLFEDIHRSSALEAMAKLESGLPANSLSHLAVLLEMAPRTIAKALGITERTLRKRTGRLSAGESERIYRAYRFFRQATDVLGDETNARAWMATPQIALGDKRPLELLRLDVGYEVTLNVLNAIEGGGYL